MIFDVMLYEHERKERTMKQLLLLLIMAGTLAGASFVEAAQVGVKHWERTWPAGRITQAETTYDFLGEFLPGKNYDDKKWLRRGMPFTEKATLSFGGKQEITTTSWYVNPKVGFFYTLMYGPNEGITIKPSARMKTLAVDPWTLDSTLRKEEEAFRKEHWALRTWLSKQVSWGTLAKKRKEQEDALKARQREEYKRITGREPEPEPDGWSYPYSFEDKKDFQKLCELAKEKGMGEAELESLRDGFTVVRTISDEFSNRVLHIRTPKARAVPNGILNDFAEGDAEIYWEEEARLDEMAKVRLEERQYSYAETQAWKQRIRALGKIAALNRDKLDGLSEELAERGITNPLEGYRRLTRKNGLSWAKGGDYVGGEKNKAYKYFYEAHKAMEVYLPIWGERENREACLPGDRFVGETWNIPGSIFNGLKHRDLDNYEFTGEVTVQRFADDVPEKALRILEDANGKMRKCYVLKIVPSGEHKNGERSETTLALVPKDKDNPNLYSLRYQDAKNEENFIYIDTESGLPVWVEFLLEADVVGREKEIDMERTKGLELKAGSKLIFRMRWQTTDIQRRTDGHQLWD